MSLNTTFKTKEDLMEYLNSVDIPQCFTANYLPETGEYDLWIGNQPYYNYERLIELEEKDNDKLIEKVKELEKELKKEQSQKIVDNDKYENNYNLLEEHVNNIVNTNALLILLNKKGLMNVDEFYEAKRVASQNFKRDNPNLVKDNPNAPKKPYKS